MLSIIVLQLSVISVIGSPFVSREIPIPEQVHLSIADQPRSMRVHWVTLEEVVGESPMVQYGTQPNALDHTANARMTIFESDGVIRFMHSADMLNLTPATTYFYRVGSPSVFSRIFEFRSFPSDGDFPLRVCIFGDLGVDNGISLVHLQRAAERDEFDLVIHVGDIGYDLHKENGTVGDSFMRGIESIASRVPYMVIAGNHEQYNNFTHYRHRFQFQPNDAFGDSQTYSFDLGNVHFVGVSTEYIGFFYEYGKQSVIRQHQWLRNDLAKANANRDKTPWLIAYQHRPFYCSNKNSFECNSFENTLIRKGFEEMEGLEALYLDYNVDIGFAGHEHSYERLYPIADRRVYNLTRDPYHNSQAPVYVCSGSAGCHTPHASFQEETPTPGSAFRSVDYGWTMMHVLNKTTIYIEQISIEKGVKPIDAFWITKDIGHRHLTKRSNNFYPFPSYEIQNFCDMEDPRCRFKRDNGLLNYEPRKLDD
ncbi:Purple acid phosphatase [Aphelenchoides besseyi]|nr:Purple acid phosphatase [Aphelenchoides besseyi]KAI6199748.1 Purple acid phosphatase [Aphelenchoides besseyi]